MNPADRDRAALPATPKPDLYIQPGVQYKEGDIDGAAKNTYLPPESSIRRAKGDLGEEHIENEPVKPLTHPGAPFKGLRGGK